MSTGKKTRIHVAAWVPKNTYFSSTQRENQCYKTSILNLLNSTRVKESCTYRVVISNPGDCCIRCKYCRLGLQGVSFVEKLPLISLF